MVVALRETNFNLPGQVGGPYRGKVGDVYTIEHEAGELLAMVRTDRISAFDVILPKLIPFKGQVLNQLSAEGLAVTDVPNWFIGSPDPNVTIGYKADPFKVEMIIRGYLLGSAWRGYQEGAHELGGNQLPEGMTEFQAFDEPIITPTTKAEAGHDQDITPDEIVDRGLATSDAYEEMSRLTKQLFAEGQAKAHERGLLLADTKYEFGRLATGQIVVIDEINTPDSSRYFPNDEYTAYLNGQTKQRPEQLSKEFVREWLVSQGFSGKDGQIPPDMPEEFIEQVTARYIDLYERMLGYAFEPAYEPSEATMLERIHRNIARSLGALSVRNT
jgi:phosphoribosylaminoimidazole-succinocarboxamide synthase